MSSCCGATHECTATSYDGLWAAYRGGATLGSRGFGNAKFKKHYLLPLRVVATETKKNHSKLAFS